MVEENWLTVIIPFQNGERWLGELLTSLEPLAGASYIFVADGSTDNSVAMIHEAHLAYAQVINNDGAGVSDARNTGLRYVETPWVMFVDSDDVIDATIVNNFRCNLLSDADVVNFSRNEIENASVRLPDNRTEMLADYVQMGHKPVFFPSVCGKLYRTEFLTSNHLRFVSGLRHGEDRLFNLQVLLTAKLVQKVPESFYYYRRNQSSVCRTISFNIEHTARQYLRVGRELLGDGRYESVWQIFSQFGILMYADLMIYQQGPNRHIAHVFRGLMREFRVNRLPNHSFAKNQSVRYMLLQMNCIKLMQYVLNKSFKSDNSKFFLI